MAESTTELASRARSIFDDLGYTVVGDGAEFRAERAWKVVRVSATAADPDLSGTGGLHCYVTERESVRALRRQLRSADPEFEWAIIAVDGEDYEVERAPPGPEAAT